PKMFPQKRGHSLTGPVAVHGARPGDMLSLHLAALHPGPWGWTVAAAADSPVTRRLGLTYARPASLLWEIDTAAGTCTADRGFVRALAPFLGVIGLAPAAPGEHSTVPPRTETGGNIDCRELIAGATLFLPVSVEGALLYLGDGHAAQGDGEVGGTAIECPMTTEVVVDLATGPAVGSVHAETPAGRITFGFDADLNVAMGDALEAMIGWMQHLFDLDKATALALASTCVDLRITQVANQTWGVHAVLPAGVIAFAADPTPSWS
ncbi:MAG: acetamidase/formamidase family protein, partial [Propionibacteriaceae bacterium]|nr:acetamidase/formamidase family protein [Propionibacteriaceae bacterium]